MATIKVDVVSAEGEIFSGDASMVMPPHTLGKAMLQMVREATYALAKELQAPLLFKGDDFAHTDLERG